MAKKKLGLWLGIGGGCAALVTVAVVCVVLFAFLIPYNKAENSMDPNGVVSVYEQTDGSLKVEWPAGINADSYTMEIRSGDQILFAYTGDQTNCQLPELPDDQELTIRVSSSHKYGSGARKGSNTLEATGYLRTPKMETFDWTVDPDQDTLSVSFTAEEGAVCRMFWQETEEQTKFVQELNAGKATVAFGDGAQFPMPSYEQPSVFVFDVYKKSGNLVYYSAIAATATLEREDFLGTVLQLHYVAMGNNVYELSWNETKGEHYEIQLSTDNGTYWHTVHSVPCDGERTYTTDHLEVFQNYKIRVVALGGQTMPDSEYAATPSEVNVTTAQCAIYATVWPLMELDVYADTLKENFIGKAPAGKAYCVLEEVNGFFGIRYTDGTMGYIDSNYCLINLPEYIGDRCSYDIVNSYDSLYMIHEYGIEEVTGEVIEGYERVKTGSRSYLVPLLYPAAQKLLKAAEIAEAKGYRLKIYDSFRPREASLSIYDLTSEILDDPVPTKTYTGKDVSADFAKLSWKAAAVESAVALLSLDETEQESTPEQQETVPEQTTEPTTPEGETPPAEEPEEEEPKEEEPWDGAVRGLTLRILMTDDGRYLLYNFLAQTVSKHNIGTAMDLTLETMDRKEVQMQTRIHDLSWFSEVKKNNNAANTLSQIMTSAGFGTLFSEWWHFQDNDAEKQLKPTFLMEGVTPECWMKDDHGWRYRQADGRYLTDCTRKIDGITYEFDAAGYLVIQEVSQ